MNRLQHLDIKRPRAENFGRKLNRRYDNPGGQHRVPIGTSTKDKCDRHRDAEALADFEAEWELYRYGVLAGREW